MTAQLIDTTVMPADDMSPGLIEAAATNFRSVGAKVSTRGGTLATDWQNLATVYEAPESEKLTQAMDPAKAKAEAFGSDLDAAAKALDSFADTVRTIKAEVAKIRADAAAFLGGIIDGKVNGSYYGGGEIYSEPRDWHTDPASVDANNALIRRTNDQQEALEAAERICATAIRAAVGLGPVRPRTAANPGGHGSIDIPDDAPMPWGVAGARTEGCVDHVTTGVLADGLGGLLTDAGSLAGLSYTEDEGLAWSLLTMRDAGLGVLTFAAGAATIGPVGLAAAHAAPGPVGRFLRNSQLAVAAGIGGLVALDLYANDPLHKWKRNGARASGEVLFNAATFVVAPLKAAKFGELGPRHPDALSKANDGSPVETTAAYRTPPRQDIATNDNEPSRSIDQTSGATEPHGADRASTAARYNSDFALGQLLRGGRTTATELDAFGATQGWVRNQTANGPIKYTDENGIDRLVIKRGSARTPGSAGPHVQVKNAAGERVDPYGIRVSRKSPGNHSPIEWDR